MVQTDPHNIAVIFLHPACNMACTFCITEDNFDSMTQAHALELLDTLKNEGFTSVVFGGGEPFEWSGDLLSLTKAAKQMGFLVQVGTNGVALPKDYNAIASIDRYVLPIESSLSDIHNKMRLYKNKHHQLIIGCLNALRSVQKPTTLSTIITKVNKDSLGSLATFLNEFNSLKPFIHAWHLYKFLPQGRGGGINADALMISDQEYEEACDMVKGMDLPFKIYQRKDMYHSKSVDFFWYEHGQLQCASKKGDSCNIGKMTVPFV